MKSKKLNCALNTPTGLLRVDSSEACRPLLISAFGRRLVQAQLCRLSPRSDGSSWWQEMVEAVSCGKLVAGGWMLASMLSIWCPSLQGFRSRRRERKEEKQKRGERESAWKVSMVTFVSLFLIAHVILLLATLHPACRPAVYSVLVTLSRLCCLFVPTSSPLTLWFEAFTLSQQAHLQMLSPSPSHFYSLYPISDLHL